MARKKPVIVTPEIVAEVKANRARYPEMSADLLGRLSNISDGTVYKILKGQYDEAPRTAANDEAAIAMLELADALNGVNAAIASGNESLSAICLGLAVLIDPSCGKSKPVAELLRKVARGDADDSRISA